MPVPGYQPALHSFSMARHLRRNREDLTAGLILPQFQKRLRRGVRRILLHSGFRRTGCAEVENDGLCRE